jgi:organic radical activating enzyme
MKHIFENKVEFYITNVCNLTCENCNRFNNHHFTGWQDWNEYAPVYQSWSEFIDIRNIVLLGGEPLLNPTICQWVAGLHKIFNADIQILTNGFQLLKVRDLYNTLLTNSGHVSVSLHHTDHFEQLRANILQFLGPIKEEYGEPIGQDRKDGIFYSVRDVNNVLVNMHVSRDFQQSAVIPVSNGRFTLHKSDPQLAHAICGFARYKCYHFIKGKIYKCGPVALMPEFDQQHNLDITDEERKILNSYQPMTIETWNTHGTQWIEELDNPIDQCRFCPDYAKHKMIFPVLKSNLKTK